MPSEKQRCAWASGDPLYEKYHDTEWGKPLKDDDQLFEFLILECFQAGLSWITILRKRENFRNAFSGFDARKIAKYTQKDIDRLMQDAGIVRNKRKISAAISNAKAFLKVQKEFGSFSDFLWGFVDDKPIVNKWKDMSQIPAKTELAEVISKEMKKCGFRFVGPTIIYAHMQATGMVNDHVVGCFRWMECVE
ncbi:MAG: DNA-3-methyladenine glycosylase I [Thermoplasmata archaeon]|nr:DNA-3-methyladenine glycosylase I [Thermoplasmata archaeon]